MLCSDTFPTMPIKHLRRGCFVTHSKITICYPLIINAKHGYIENLHQYVELCPDGMYGLSGGIIVLLLFQCPLKAFVGYEHVAVYA